MSNVAYIIGIKQEKFGENQNFDEEVYKKLNANKNARIIRSLCMLRNELEHCTDIPIEHIMTQRVMEEKSLDDNQRCEFYSKHVKPPQMKVDDEGMLSLSIRENRRHTMGLFGGDDSWQDHGPGTLEWDYMFGGNHTGLYPDKIAFAISDDEEKLYEYTFTHAGGSSWNGEITDSWDIEKLVRLEGIRCSYVFHIHSTGQWIKATKSTEFKDWDDGVLVTIKDIGEPDEAFKKKYYG